MHGAVGAAATAAAPWAAEEEVAPLTAEPIALGPYAYTLPGLVITSHFDSDIGLVGWVALPDSPPRDGPGDTACRGGRTLLPLRSSRRLRRCHAACAREAVSRPPPLRTRRGARGGMRTHARDGFAPCRPRRQRAPIPLPPKHAPRRTLTSPEPSEEPEVRSQLSQACNC
jgi:hypothetical protein